MAVSVTVPNASLRISAVRWARGSGLVRIAYGLSSSLARPRAAWRIFFSPSGVSGRSSSGMPGVPRSTAAP